MRDELFIMKLLSTGLVMGVLVAGLLLSPFVSGNPIINKVFAQEEEGPVKQVLLVANENQLQIALY